MANYLPVLLVSVAANTTPDDSSVSTLPRGQVDYLSHDWEEEDVWRSWRNMTRQKNEIANGVRLENASWRTWWKRRNGLGTVTPETLNWLKDSDVTWLYGPLHTADDWTPPPKPIHDTVIHTSTLNISTARAITHKPILKHRSISQLLTSDLPNSPKFASPIPSDEEIDYVSLPLHFHIPKDQGGNHQLKRPGLSHAKSDTQITRWGRNRTFRTTQLNLPTPQSEVVDTGLVGHSPTHPDSTSSNASSDTNTALSASGDGQKKRHISFNTFVEQYIAIEEPKKGTSIEDEDDDSHRNRNDARMEEYTQSVIPARYRYGRNAWGYDDGYEEDEEDSAEEEPPSLSVWDEQYDGTPIVGSGMDSDESEKGKKEEDCVRPSSYETKWTKKPSQRSHSTVSNTSSSSSASTSTSTSTTSTSSYSSESLPKHQSSRRCSTSTTSTYRPFNRSGPSASTVTTNFLPSKQRRRNVSPPFIRSPTDTSEKLQSQTTHVTIAPMAPTILKTGNYGGPDGWVEGFGDDGSDDEVWEGGKGNKWWYEQGNDAKKEDDTGTGSEGTTTPVELVYVPRLGSNYNMRPRQESDIGYEQNKEWKRSRNGEDMAQARVMVGLDSELEGGVIEGKQNGFGNSEQEVYRHRSAKFSVGDDDADVEAREMPEGTSVDTSVPTVVIRRPPLGGPMLHDDYLEGVDSGASLSPRRLSSTGTMESNRLSNIGLPDGFRGRNSFGFRTGSLGDMDRSTSTSTSRTPSPPIISPTVSRDSGFPTSTLSTSPPQTVSSLLRAATSMPSRKSASISPPSSALLSPPIHERGSSSHQDLRVHTRGRSSTRTGSSSLFDRERSSGQSSPLLGNLSPEGIELAGSYASGRLDKEWERQKRNGDRERSRGRERASAKRLSQSRSPEDFQHLAPSVSSSLGSSSAATIPTKPEVSPSSASSSSSSATSSSATIRDASYTPSPSHKRLSSDPIPIVEEDQRVEEEDQHNLQPTPSNSPMISMQPFSIPGPSATQHPTPTYTIKAKSPLTVSAPHPAEPSTSYSISLPHSGQLTPSSPTSPTSPSSLTRAEASIVGKAAEIVSSAGAFLGLWHHQNGGNG